MSKDHNPLGKITSLCCPELGIFFVFNTCTGTRVALINPVGNCLIFCKGRLSCGTGKIKRKAQPDFFSQRGKCPRFGHLAA
jgi:hypothetical protein